MKIAYPVRSAQTPGITAVIPCYNYGRYLPAATGAVLEQADVDARVIIVDDASPDGSGSVARELAAREPRITVIQHTSNRGHIATYNDGLAAVETEYATLISADDMVAPGAFSRATALMGRFPTVGLVYGRAPVFSESRPIARAVAPLPYLWAIWSGARWLRGRVRAGKNPILSPEVVMRTAAVREIGGYNPELPHAGDLEYWLRTCRAGWDVGRVIGHDQAYYRVHDQNMHTVHFDDEQVQLTQLLGAFAFLPAGDGGESAESLRDWRNAQSAVARLALVSALRQLDSGASPETAVRLLSFAESLELTSATRRLAGRVSSRVERAKSGLSPTTVQRIEEHARQQGDRIRFKFLEVLGE